MCVHSMDCPVACESFSYEINIIISRDTQEQEFTILNYCIKEYFHTKINGSVHPIYEITSFLTYPLCYLDMQTVFTSLCFEISYLSLRVFCCSPM